MLSLPSITAPASHNFCVTVDSYGGTNPCRIFEQAVAATSNGVEPRVIANWLERAPDTGKLTPEALAGLVEAWPAWRAWLP